MVIAVAAHYYYYYYYYYSPNIVDTWLTPSRPSGTSIPASSNIVGAQSTI